VRERSLRGWLCQGATTQGLICIGYQKGFINDHLRGGKKAAIFHVEIERISGTLFDHPVTEAQ
jgi:hypothetical protein